MAETGCLKDGHFQNLEVAGNIIVAQDDFTLTSTAGSSKPEFVLNQDKTGLETSGPIINLKNSSGGGTEDGNGVTGDLMGTITFTGQDDGGGTHDFSKIISSSANATAESELGKLDFQVACGSGVSTSVVSIEGGATEGSMTVGGHLITTGVAPGITPTAAHESGTCTISSNSTDTCGEITFGGTWANSDTVVITFTSQYASAPIVFLSTPNTAGGTSTVNFASVSVSASAITITASDTCAGTLNYLVIETK